MPGKDEIFTQVQGILVDALSVDEEEVAPEATLTGDLGAESIDFLDIVFRLEKTFDIKIPRGELFPENLLTDERYVKDGRFTEEGLNELRQRMPFADLDEFAASPDIKKFSSVFTVQMICNYIESKLSAVAS
jgi:acyl carrier protein